MGVDKKVSQGKPTLSPHIGLQKEHSSNTENF